MKTVALFVGLVVAAMAATAQDTPQEIARKDLPKLAECSVCKAKGTPMGMEKPAAGLMYKGTAYYLCSNKEIAEFKKDPEAFVPPVLPRPMPAFRLNDESGKLWDAEAMKGKLILVDWWATWCKPCVAMMPMVHKLREEFAGKGFEVLSVSIDEKRGDLDKFLRAHQFANPVLHDTAKIWSAWSIRAIPALFLVKDGRIVAQWTGKQSEQSLRTAMEANLGN